MFIHSASQAIPTRENETAFLPASGSRPSPAGRVARLAGSLAISPLTALLLAQAAVFAAAVASGKIPPAVLTLFRALLTL